MAMPSPWVKFPFSHPDSFQKMLTMLDTNHNPELQGRLHRLEELDQFQPDCLGQSDQGVQQEGQDGAGPGLGHQTGLTAGDRGQVLDREAGDDDDHQDREGS